MIDPVSAFAMASAAYNAVKKGIEVGQELDGMAGQLGKWFSACADIKEAEEQAKNPPLFKKLLHAGSVEEEALQSTIRRKKIEEQEKELREMILYRFGMDTYREMMEERRRIATERKRIAFLQEQRRKDMLLNVLYFSVIGICCYLLYLMAMFVWESLQ
jgi:hypothetical protein